MRCARWGAGVDVAGFDAAMAEQKAKARAAWAGSGEAADATVWYDIAEEHGVTEFLGYDTEVAEGQIMCDREGWRDCRNRLWPATRCRSC